MSVIATNNSSTSLQCPLFCVFGGSNCIETMSLSDCNDVIVNRNYSIQNGTSITDKQTCYYLVTNRYDALFTEQTIDFTTDVCELFITV